MPEFLPNIIKCILNNAFKGDGWSFSPPLERRWENKFSNASWFILLDKNTSTRFAVKPLTVLLSH